MVLSLKVLHSGCITGTLHANRMDHLGDMRGLGLMSLVVGSLRLVDV